MRFLPLLAAAATLALAGCTPGPVGGPAPAGAAHPAPPPVRIVPDSELELRVWPSRGPARAAILALHGFGDASDLTFGPAAEAWAARGIAVYALEQRGFGANASRQRWPGVDALVADAEAAAREVRRREPGVPLTVVGHSMGGGVALVAAAEGMDADALVLAGPAIAGGPALGDLARGASWTLAAALPEVRWTGRGFVHIRPTDNPAAMARVLADPRHFGNPSSRELYGLVRLMDRAAAEAPRVGIPTLTLMGAHDEVLDPERVERIAATIPGSAGYRLYPDGWHWLFTDRQAPRVWRDVGDFALAARRR
jgi:alpha-beta hydrolase superfamily lysophospholipase